MKVVVVGLLAESVVAFRGELLRSMAARGHQVLALAPEDSEAVRATLAGMGVEYRAAPIQRTGLNPLRDARTVVSLVRTFREVQADCVLVYGAKPVIYGSIAARIARVPRRSAMITGIGSALGGGDGLARRLLAQMVRRLYQVALRGVDVVFFQNPDDFALVSRLGLISRRNRTVRINGSGVDLQRFEATTLPDGPLRFLLVGRILRDKGVVEYVEAARQVRAVHPDVRFQLLGQTDTNPSAIPVATLDAWREEGVINYLGSTDDVRPYLADAHVCVLPSYGEGMPRSILEALAMGRPVIVTDVPGCRETVIDGRNGALVPVRDATALASAMMRLIDGSEELARMGRESRRLAEERFDVHAVNRIIMEALGL